MTHIPTAVVALAITYNLPAIEGTLRLSAETLADIFLGHIVAWNDPRIARDNPGEDLPDLPILIVYRSDDSITTRLFTQFLASGSDAWRGVVGSGARVSWPAGVGRPGSRGVAAQVRQTPGAIGYIDQTVALRHDLPRAAVRNPAGRFVEPTRESAGAAAQALASGVRNDLLGPLINAPGADSYPIVEFSHLHLRQDQADPIRGKRLVEFAWWVIHDGQAYAQNLGYASLPAEVVMKAEEKLRTITSHGRLLEPTG